MSSLHCLCDEANWTMEPKVRKSGQDVGGKKSGNSQSFLVETNAKGVASVDQVYPCRCKPCHAMGFLAVILNFCFAMSHCRVKTLVNEWLNGGALRKDPSQ